MVIEYENSFKIVYQININKYNRNMMDSFIHLSSYSSSVPYPLNRK